ncbi:MAG TPA: hypothetical protein PLF56_02305 [Micropruina sp.]|jgi:hypothetical protein|nr:hypothetical protein [Micropruina sp.]
MGVRGPFGVNFDEAFPHGVGIVGAVSAQRDFDKSSGDNSVQQLDAATGKRIWVVDVMDFDPEARERTFKVKIIADVQPVPPAEVAGLPVRPVRLEGLSVTPYLKEGMGRPRIAYSLRATGLAEVRRGDNKAA